MDLAGFDWEWLLIQVGVLLLSISIHESAHAWSADRLGDATARQMGRVSFNPLVHIDPVGTILFPYWVSTWVGSFLVGPSRSRSILPISPRPAATTHWLQQRDP